MSQPADSRSAVVTVAVVVALQALLVTTSIYTGGAADAPVTWHWATVAAASLLMALLVWSAPHLEAAPAQAVPHQWLYLLGIVGLAVMLRTYALDRVPPGFFQDEAINGNDAIELGHALEWKLWSTSVSGRPTLFLYSLWAVIRVFGQTYLSLKLLPLACGIATVLVVFLVARSLLDAEAALWAAFLIATSRWHVHYSRMAWEAICVPLFATAGLGLLAAGLRARRDWPYLLGSGIVLALGLYTYAAFRAVPLIAVGYLLIETVRSPTTLRAHWLGCLLGVIVFFVVATPLLLFATQHASLFWARQQEVALASGGEGSLGEFLPQLGKTVLSFHHRGDALVRHNLPFAPHLDIVTGACMLIGLVTRVALPWRATVRLLWLWLASFVLLSSLTREAPHATRLLGAVPATAIFGAIGVAWLRQQSSRLVGVTTTRILLGTAVIAIVALNVHAYFARHAHHATASQGFNVLARTLCNQLQRAPGAYVFWSDDVDYWASAQCKYLAPGVNLALDPLTLDQLFDGLPLRAPRPTIVVFGPTFVGTSRGRLAVGPDGLPNAPLPATPEIVRDGNGRLLYYYYRLD